MAHEDIIAKLRAAATDAAEEAQEELENKQIAAIATNILHAMNCTARATDCPITIMGIAIALGTFTAVNSIDGQKDLALTSMIEAVTEAFNNAHRDLRGEV